jgi:hypothetical protein
MANQSCLLWNINEDVLSKVLSVFTDISFDPLRPEAKQFDTLQNFRGLLSFAKTSKTAYKFVGSKLQGRNKKGRLILGDFYIYLQNNILLRSNSMSLSEYHYRRYALKAVSLISCCHTANAPLDMIWRFRVEYNINVSAHLLSYIQSYGSYLDYSSAHLLSYIQSYGADLDYSAVHLYLTVNRINDILKGYIGIVEEEVKAILNTDFVPHAENLTKKACRQWPQLLK